MVAMVAPDQLQRIPTEPGVYLMKDAAGRILYVGKANNLRSRVRSYFRGGGDGRLRVPALMKRVRDVDFITTGSERDALILESEMVRVHQPRFNVDLRDDKTWLSLRLDPSMTWPRLDPVRRWRKDGARYFGPYLLDTHARRVLTALRGAFPMRNCSEGVFRSHKRLGRPCLEAQMGRCAAPCVGAIDEAAYRELVERAAAALSGRGAEVRKELEQAMWAASEAEQFERAGRLRDLIEAMSRAGVRSRVKGRVAHHLDAWGLHREGDVGAVAILPVRGGQVLGGRAVPLKGVVAESDELLASLLMQLYAHGERPPEVLLPMLPAGAEELNQHLGIRFKVPARGEKRRFAELAQSNAVARHRALVDREARFERAAETLQRKLGLEAPPVRIECFDNSHLQGENGYSSMVRFVGGRPDKSGYRLFRLRSDLGGDDYAAMAETLGKRLRRGAENLEGWELPDLLVVDGGRGQLSMAMTAARELELSLPMCGIAKPEAGERSDKIYAPGRVNPLSFRPHDPALHLLQHARDEAHRFGIKAHRKARRKGMKRSRLDAVPGLGPARRRALLRRFGSVRGVAQASDAELLDVAGIGPELASRVAESLAGYGGD
jgi:excinuclease ABC subunit C